MYKFIPKQESGIFLIAAIIMLVPNPAVSQDEIKELGRLFIDAEQREKLEAVRRGTYKADVEQESRISNVRVDGVMIRSGGNNVVWINGENTLSGPPIDGVRVNADKADKETYSVQVMIDGRRVKLKPGQNWSEGTGTIKDNY